MMSIKIYLIVYLTLIRINYYKISLKIINPQKNSLVY